MAWDIVRTDGITLRFTDASAKIPFNGFEYEPSGGVNTSARRNESALKETSVDFRGVISSDKITWADLRAKRYNNAKIVEYLLDWKYPFAGAFATQTYYIADITFDGETTWTADVVGVQRWLRQKVGDVFGRTCTNQLYGTRCGVNEASFRTTTTIGTVDSTDPRRIFTITSGEATDYYKYGKVTWNSGNNNGLVADIKAHTSGAPDTIELVLPLPEDMSVADSITIAAGCDRLSSTCETKFSNIEYFRGYQYMPTTDQLLNIVRKG